MSNDTWHVESNYILQHPKYFIAIVNRFRCVNNHVTRDLFSIPMEMIIVLGPNKLSLSPTINHHGPSVYSGHNTTFVNYCKNILLQRYKIKLKLK